MDYLIEIVKKIAVFYVLSTFLMNLINDEKYKKYINMFSGIVIIILVIKPIGSLLSLEGKFTELFDFNQTVQMTESLKKELKIADERMKGQLIEEFTKKAEENIKEHLAEYNVFFRDMEIEFELDENSTEFGSIKYIFLYLSKSSDASSIDIFIEDYDSSKDIVVIEIKKYISEVYKINKNNIYVNISL